MNSNSIINVFSLNLQKRSKYNLELIGKFSKLVKRFKTL